MRSRLVLEHNVEKKGNRIFVRTSAGRLVRLRVGERIVAWRWGEPPRDGISRHRITGTPEAGVSVAGIGEPPAWAIEGEHRGDRARPIYVLNGVVANALGSEHEVLLTGVEVVRAYFWPGALSIGNVQWR